MKRSWVRWFIVSLGSIALCGLLMTVCAITTGTQPMAWLSQQTIDTTLNNPRDLTATGIVRNATATAEAQQNPFVRFLNFLIPRPPPTSVPTPVGWTQTQRAVAATWAVMIHNATATMAAYFAPTQEYWATLTAVPTVSNEEGENLRQRWITELETAAGFSHAIFDEIVDELIRTVHEAAPNYVRNFRLQPEVERTNFDGDEYVAIIARSSFWFNDFRFLLFQVRDGTPELMPDPIRTQIGNIKSFNGWGGNYLGGFADRNDNGYPDLAFDTGTEGSHPPLVLVLLEIRRGGEVIDITPQIDDVRPRNMVDLDNDGILEIEALGCLSYPLPYACADMYYGLTRYYGWDGTAYHDISATLDESYWPAIGAYWENIQESDGCLLPDYGMYSMLLGYVAREQLAEGWARLQPLLRWDLCSSDIRTNDWDDMDDLVAWVEAHLEDER